VKYLLISLISFLSLNIYAQEDKTVTLLAIGQGKTQEEARQKALRGAIEQAFGVFISSRTEILNDNLVKDEIVSVANGNIQKFDIINETLLPNNTYASTLSATVSISKLTSFCQSKGINAEFKGGLFAMNIALQELNEKNEQKAFDNTYAIITEILPKAFNYKIIPSDPQQFNNMWKIPIRIDFDFNENYKIIADQVYGYLKSISLTASEVLNYEKMSKQVYKIKLNSTNDTSTFYLRSRDTYNSVLSLPITMLKYCIIKFQYDCGIEKLDVFKIIDRFSNDFAAINLESTYKFYSLPWDEYPTSFGIFSSVIRDIKHNDKKSLYKNGYDEYIIQLLSARERSINREWLKKDTVSIEKYFNIYPVDAPVVYNIYGPTRFLSIMFEEKRNIEEIKKISDYKIMFTQ
jgi:hypothetical protein